MNDAIKEVRATLAQVRDDVHKLPRAIGIDSEMMYIRQALARLANALDVLTGEVERLGQGPTSAMIQDAYARGYNAVKK